MDTADIIYGTKVQTTRSQDGTDVYCNSKGVTPGKHANVWVYRDFSLTDALGLRWDKNRNRPMGTYRAQQT